MYVVDVIRNAGREVRAVARAETPTHGRLRDSFVAIAVATIGVNLIRAVLALLFEHHEKQTQVKSFGSALFWTSTQLLTVSSSVQNPISTAGWVPTSSWRSTRSRSWRRSPERWAPSWSSAAGSSNRRPDPQQPRDRLGSHQFHRPNSATSAGTSSERTTSRRAGCRTRAPVASIFSRCRGPEPSDSEREEQDQRGAR